MATKKNITTTKTPRVTATMRFEDIIAMLEGTPVTHGTTQEQAVRFCQERIAQIAKKNATENKKPTKTQEANVGYRADILSYLRSLPDDSQGQTCTEILRGVPSIFNAGFGVPKISALCYDLVDEGSVVVDEWKNKTIFRAVR